MKTFKKEITVDVPKKDQKVKHERLVEVDRELLAVKAEKDSANGEFNGQLKALRNEQKSILDTIETGQETIEVECYEEVDESRLEMVTKRVDNDQILPELTRPLTPEERQMGFDGGDAA